MIKAVMVDVLLKLDSAPVKVGSLAYEDHKIYFEYDTRFIQMGFEISPFKLPLKIGLQQGDPNLFEGLPGVFNDSLPDGWGRLLLDRAVRKHGILPGELTPIDRLTYVGEHGMGALMYRPSNESIITNKGKINLDQLANESKHILRGDSETIIEEMLVLNGSSMGARPKAMIGLSNSHKDIIYGVDALSHDYTHWLVKFSNSTETSDSGAIEYAYSQMAKLAGIQMMDTQLLNQKRGPGFFATKRFDRQGDQRLHIHSACGLLYSDFRAPCMDYKDLLKATGILTQEKEDSINLFRQAVFNVLAFNRDDHAKNISFMMNNNGQWHLTPAYDLTFSSGPGGEQSTLVMGKGKDITHNDLILLALSAQISKQEALQIIDQTRQAISQWETIARDCGVGSGNVQRIKKILRVKNV